MNKHFALYFLLFASLLIVSGTSFEIAAQEEKPTVSKTDPIDELLRRQREKAFEKRSAPTGENPRGVIVPAELSASIVKQQAKLAEMKQNGFVMPLDYAGMANLLLNGSFVEVPRATETFYLEVGGNATEAALTSFDFEKGQTVLQATDAQYVMLKKLADDFYGTRYDLDDPADRRKFKMRLMRTLAPRAKTVLEEIAAAYSKQFQRPLRIVALSRSIEYQIDLNLTNANSFKVRDRDSLPSHSSGLAFDIAFKQMTAAEQNFLMKMIARLEKDGKVDGLRETGVNAVLHVFVYGDGVAPKI